MSIAHGLAYAVSAAGWSLVHLLWQSAILALALIAALRILKRSSANLRYRICCVAMAGMALCPVMTWSTIECLPVIHSSAAKANGASGSLVPAHSEEPRVYIRSKDLIDGIDHHITAILALWSGGAFIGLVRFFIFLAAAKRLRTSSAVPAPERLQSSANRIASQLGMTGFVRLLVSGNVTAPVVVGWRRPAMILPASSLAGLSLQEQESVLAHELAHIRRHDYPVNVTQAVLEAVLFCHPAIRWVSRQIRREREHCCDDLALLISGSALVYVKALVLLEEQRSPLKPQLSLGAHGGELSMRIKRLFEQNQKLPLHRSSFVSLASLAALTLGTLAVLSVVATDRVSAQTSQADRQQTSAATGMATQSRRPDMSCTYYEKSAPHSGVCEGAAETPGTFYCRQSDGDKLRQVQSGCQWKVERLRAWELQQHLKK